MVTFQVFNVVTHVYGDPQAHYLLNSALRYRDKNYFFSPQYKSGKWDGFTNLYNQPNEKRGYGKLLTGLLFRAKSVLTSAGIDADIQDCRQAPPQQNPLTLKLKIEDRNFQTEQLIAAVSKTRGVIQAPTGSGKTISAAMILAQLNLPSLFLVHKLSIFEQTLTDFRTAFGRELVGVIQGQRKTISRFNVAMIQTLDSALWSAADNHIKPFVNDECKVLIVDECHHSASDSYKRVIQQFTNSYYRFGLSATPHKYQTGNNSDMQVEGLFGRVIHKIERQELEDAGHLAKSKVFFL